MPSKPLLNTAQPHHDDQCINKPTMRIGSSSVNKGRVLLVDDEPYILQVMEEILGADGYTVECAQDGESALTAFNKNPFPLLITDMRLGGKIDGLGLLKHIKKDHPDTHFIIITSFGTMEIAIKALRMGAYDFITKPFDDIDVISISVRRVFEKINLVAENHRLVEKLKSQNQELATLNSELENRVRTDGLTGLFNHRFFQQFLTKEILRAERHQQQFALLFLDLDDFKQYNDTYGHIAGDKILVNTARFITDTVRHSDIVARYGGEEFVVILLQTDLISAQIIADNIRKRIAEELNDHAQQTINSVTVSIGIAMYPDHGKESAILVGKADKALYKAKFTGKDCVCIAS